MKRIEYHSETREIVARIAPDGQALIRLADRELLTARRDRDGTNHCPLELIGASLAA